MLTQPVFDEYFFRYLWDKDAEDDFVRIINRFLLHVKGVITKFVLYIDRDCDSVKVEDISHWISFLSTKGIKDLTLEIAFPIKLPTDFFSFLELEHLKLVECCFDPPPSFHGFPNLLSLELSTVKFECGKFGEFFTRYPVLEVLTMDYPYKTNNMDFPKVKLDELAKLANLKILSLFLCNLESTGSGSIFELMGFLPKLQELDINFSHCKFTEGVAERTTFPCLKTLKLSEIDLGNGIGLSYTFQMIRSFPNLQNLEITISDWDVAPTPGIYSPEVDYNTMWLLELRRVVFRYLKGSENEVWLIKYLLACSPFLQKFLFRLHFSLLLQQHSHLSCDEKFIFATKLLNLHRASHVVAIDLC